MDEKLEQEEPKKQRKRYERPTVISINLRPEEAVLGTCKSNTAAGPINSTCRAIGNCRGIGS
jgi:hypothetical protein